MNNRFKSLSSVLIFFVMITCFTGCGSNKSNHRTSEGSVKEEKQIVPGEKWFDTDGEIINAHGSVRLLVTGERNSLRRYPCAPWSSISSNPARSALFAASTKACWTASISARSISFGVWWVDENGMGEGAITCQPPSSLGINTRLSPPEAQVLPFLPAWANWMAGTAPCSFMKEAIRCSPSTCSPL